MPERGFGARHPHHKSVRRRGGPGYLHRQSLHPALYDEPSGIDLRLLSKDLLQLLPDRTHAAAVSQGVCASLARVVFIRSTLPLALPTETSHGPSAIHTSKRVERGPWPHQALTLARPCTLGPGRRNLAPCPGLWATSSLGL